MKTQAAVVADDAVYLNWLQNAAPGTEFSALRPVDAADLLERLQLMGRVDMVFFQVDKTGLAARLSMMEHLVERMPELPLAAVGTDGDPDVVLACMRAGARDFFVLRRDESNVAASLGRLLRRSAQAQQAARGCPRGKVFTLLGAHPHEALAFNAEHLALACAASLPPGERVLLVDIATPAGAGAIFLNVVQSYTVLDAINDVYRCDQTLVDTAFPRHGSGLFLLSLPEDLIGRPQIAAEEFAKLLQLLRGLFAVTVVAADGLLPMELLKEIIAGSERLLLLADQSILKSRHSKYLLRALRLEDCPLDRAGLLVDNYRRRVGLEPANLAELLDLRLVGTLSCDLAARTQSMNAGEPVFKIAPKDDYCSDVRRLAQALLGGEAAVEPGPRGLLGKVFG
jgi:pilus assembly protein CpaE